MSRSANEKATSTKYARTLAPRSVVSSFCERLVNMSALRFIPEHKRENQSAAEHRIKTFRKRLCHEQHRKISAVDADGHIIENIGDQKAEAQQADLQRQVQRQESFFELSDDEAHDRKG